MKNPHSPALVLLGLLGALLLIELAWQWGIPLPTCAFRHYTGIPCPLCGSTRCLRSLAHLEFARALRFNPLVFLACAAVAAAAGVGLICRLLRQPAPDGWGERLLQKPWSYVLFLAVGLNWLYLVCWL